MAKTSEAVIKKRMTSDGVKALWELYAAYTVIWEAYDKKELRVDQVQNGRRDIRMIAKRLDSIIAGIEQTIPDERMATLLRQRPYMRFGVRFGQEVARQKEMTLLPADLLYPVMIAAHEMCKLCPDPDRCKSCDLGKAFDAALDIDRMGRSWLTVYFGEVQKL